MNHQPPPVTASAETIAPSGGNSLPASRRSAPLDIVFVCNHAPGQGAPHQLMAAYWLAGRGHCVTAVVPAPKSSRDIPGRDCVHLSIVAVPHARYRLVNYLAMAIAAGREVFNRKRPGLLYAQGGNALLSVWWMFFWLPSRRLVYHTQDFFEPGRHRFWSLLERICCRRAGLVVSNDASRARVLASLARLETMPLVVRTALPADWRCTDGDMPSVLAPVNELTKDKERVLVMHAGMPAKARCGSQLLDAIALLPSGFTVVMSGFDGSLAVDALDSRMPLWIANGRVVLLPELTFAQLLAAMQLCDVGLLLYANDGIGNFFQCPGRLTEYLNSGLSIVASDHPTLRSVIKEHHLGDVCDSSSPQDIARVIAFVGSTRIMQGKAAERARLTEVARTDLSYELDGERLEERLFSLVNR